MKNSLDLKRPLSWSSISSFEYDKEEWYRKYILKEEQVTTKEMAFGKIFADSCEAGKPLAPVTLFKEVEYPLQVIFSGIPLVGYIDTYDPHTRLGEFKTGKKAWDQKRADEHRQIDMYLLMLFITHKVRPEDIQCFLQWIPTEERGDFTINFIDPVTVHTFKTKRTMAQVLNFGVYVKSVYKEMQEFTKNHE